MFGFLGITPEMVDTNSSANPNNNLRQIKYHHEYDCSFSSSLVHSNDGTCVRKKFVEYMSK
jgi:hypothetical protein